MVDWSSPLITITLGPLMVVGATYAVAKAGLRFRGTATRVGIWVGGGLGVGAMAVFGALEAAITGAHPVALLLMLFVAFYGAIGGAMFGGLLGALGAQAVAFLSKK